MIPSWQQKRCFHDGFSMSQFTKFYVYVSDTPGSVSRLPNIVTGMTVDKLVAFESHSRKNKLQVSIDATTSSDTMLMTKSLQWRHNECDGVSNHRRLDCFLNSFLGTDQGKHQSSASLAFVSGIHRWPVNSPHKGPVTRKMFPFDDVSMIEVLYSCGIGTMKVDALRAAFSISVKCGSKGFLGKIQF